MVKTDIFVPLEYTAADVKDAVCQSLPVGKDEIGEIKIFKKALTLGEKRGYALTLGISFSEEREAGLLKMKKKVSAAPDYELHLPKLCAKFAEPVVVGAGPAGLFAALTLAECGLFPIVIERGDPVDRRRNCVDRFFSTGDLDTESNVQFGEGGAGAFSDGKLKVGGMDKYKYKVLSEFVSAGAPEDIIYTKGAHLGTDKLPLYVAGIREKIKSLGGKFIYRARLVGIDTVGSQIKGVSYIKDGREERIDTDTVILATGHSAKDTFEMLLSLGVPMEARGFGIGVRIEHPREYMNRLVYKDDGIADIAGTASYHLVTHLKNGRSVYSFCMCPGGHVVAAASEAGHLVTNGMSEYMRDAENSNAAHLVSVRPEDFGSDSPLAGIDLQRKIERCAFRSGGGGFSAPIIRMDDFIRGGKASSPLGINPSYPCGTSPASPDEYLPSFVSDSLRQGILDFDEWMRGFYYPDAILTGAETRSTSPVRIIRGEDYSSPAIKGLYPIGEGAGYAGGIVSSGVDGVRVCESIARNRLTR